MVKFVDCRILLTISSFLGIYTTNCLTVTFNLSCLAQLTDFSVPEAPILCSLAEFFEMIISHLVEYNRR